MVKDIIFDESDQSEFNAAIATLMRIHEIKKWLAIATAKNDLYFYYQHIKMFYKELAPMFKLVKEKEEYVDKEDDKKEKKTLTLKEYQQKRFDAAKELKFTSSNLEEKKDVLEFLEEWELELRQIEQDKGMNLPKKPDARWSLSRGR